MARPRKIPDPTPAQFRALVAAVRETGKLRNAAELMGIPTKHVNAWMVRDDAFIVAISKAREEHREQRIATLCEVIAGGVAASRAERMLGYGHGWSSKLRGQYQRIDDRLREAERVRDSA